MKKRALNATDVTVLRRLRELTASVGHCSLSTRQFYELSGIGRKAVQRSLFRLASAGLAHRLQAARGGASARWIALPAVDWSIGENVGTGLALMGPRKGAQPIVPDAFRRSDLRSPWLLYTQLPAIPLTVEEVVDLCSLTTRKRTAEWWLLILASLLPPLVDASSAKSDCRWTKLPLNENSLDEIAAHLQALASNGQGRHLHTAQHAQLQNQLERESNLWRREAKYGY